MSELSSVWASIDTLERILRAAPRHSTLGDILTAVAAITPGEATTSPMAGFAETPASPEAVPPSVSEEGTQGSRRIRVDRVWSSSTDEGEEYWCLRLSAASASADARTRSFGSPPPDSSYSLLAAAEISLTLEFDPLDLTAGEIMALTPAGVES